MSQLVKHYAGYRHVKTREFIPTHVTYNPESHKEHLLLLSVMPLDPDHEILSMKETYYLDETTTVVINPVDKGPFEGKSREEALLYLVQFRKCVDHCDDYTRHNKEMAEYHRLNGLFNLIYGNIKQ